MMANTKSGQNAWGIIPEIKVLLLHGGPVSTHEYFESFDIFFPPEDITLSRWQSLEYVG